MGKVHGKQALFPANYVEKISQPGPFPNEKSGRSYAASQAPPSNPVDVQPEPEQEEPKKKGFIGKYKNTVSNCTTPR
jgi:hypothetical protein